MNCKSIFLISCLAFWWLFWLGYSFFVQDVFIPPSTFVFFKFTIFVLFFVFGAFLSVYINSRRVAPPLPQEFWVSKGGRFFYIATVLFLAVCLASYANSLGAFRIGYRDFFLSVRGAGAEPEFGTNLIDSFFHFLGFPFALFSVILGLFARNVRACLFLGVLYLLGFAYVYQVNYPVMHLFWIMIFYVALQGASLKIITTLIISLLLIVGSAANRYGGLDFLGILEYYIVGYHVVGFSLYGIYFNDLDGPLHDLTFGLSSLGFLSKSAFILLAKLGFGLEDNVLSRADVYLSNTIVVGVDGSRESNAFGTMLFTFYRDFSFPGVLLGGFLFGYFTLKSYIYSVVSIRSKMLFVLLSSAWVMGFMVSPIERPYFWFCLIFIYFTSRRFIFSNRQ